MNRQEIIQRIKDIVLTFQMLNDTEIITIIKNSEDTTNITDYEIMQIIKNIKTSIDNLSQPSLDIMSTISKVIENYDQKKWVPGKRLGEGGFGWVEIQEYDGRKVAYKQIKKYQKATNLTSDFIHEIGSYAILTAIGSENTPKLVGFNINNNEHLGIAIELADIDSFDWLVSFPLPNEPGYQEGVEKRKELLPVIVDKLLESLEEIQSVGLVHNDIKPENILLTFNSDGTIEKTFLTDFGFMSSVPMKGPLVYNESYRAPEIWQGEDSSFASDCWATGMSIIRLCLQTKDYYENKNEIYNLPRLPIPEITAKLAEYLRPEQVDLINHMVSWDPKNRCIKRVMNVVPQRKWILPENTRFQSSTFGNLVVLTKENKLSKYTLPIALDIFFRYYNNMPETFFDEEILDLSGFCALYIASLWADKTPLTIRSFYLLSHNTPEEMIKHTYDMLKVINGLIWVPGLDRSIENLSNLSSLFNRSIDFNTLL